MHSALNIIEQKGQILFGGWDERLARPKYFTWILVSFSELDHADFPNNDQWLIFQSFLPHHILNSRILQVSLLLILLLVVSSTTPFCKLPYDCIVYLATTHCSFTIPIKKVPLHAKFFICGARKLSLVLLCKNLLFGLIFCTPAWAVPPWLASLITGAAF